MSQTERPHFSARLKETSSLGRVARTSVLWAYVRTAVIGVVGVPATIALARLLSPADFGIAAAAIFFGQLSARLASGGMGVALVRVKVLRDEHISTVFVINLAMAAFGSIALILAAPHIAAFYGAPEVGWILPLVALNFAFGALSSVQQALLSRDLRYKDLATIGSIDAVVAACSAVLFASLGFRYWSLVLGDVCGAFVKWMAGVYMVGWHVRPRFVPAAARELGSFAMASYVKRLLEHLTRTVDNVIVGRMLGVTALGFYDKAYSVGNKVSNKMTVVGPSVAFRILAILQDEPERFRRAYRKIIMTTTLLGYLVFGAIATMAPQLVIVALGDQWAPSVVPLQILCVAFSLRLLTQYTTTAAAAMGWVWPQVWRQIVALVCIIVGVYLAAPWGIVGAATAIALTAGVNVVLGQTIMGRATGMRWADTFQPQVPALAAATALIGLLWGVEAALGSRLGAALTLAAQAVALGVFLLAFAWWCPFAAAREVMHESVADFSPRLASWLWKDVVVESKEERRKRRKRDALTAAAGTSESGTEVVS